MSDDKEKKFEELRQERLKKLREFEEIEDAIRYKKNQALNDLDELQRTAYHYLAPYSEGAPEVLVGLSQVDGIKEDLLNQIKSAQRKIDQERDDYEYDYRIEKRKISED